MSTTGILRSRRSAAQLHAIASVEREIRSADPVAGRKYLRDFQEAYRSYEKVLTATDVRREIAEAGITLIGDYHALPNSQRYLTSLLREHLSNRPLVLGVETIFSRDQHILDEWSRREIDEDEFRQRIRFELDWGYDWTPFYEMLSVARDRGALICGLDCAPREDLRKIGARDRHAADKITELRHLHPEALILVLFGESHLAPQHLPALLAQRLPDEPLLTVLQNVDALYWRAAGEDRDHVEAVQVRRKCSLRLQRNAPREIRKLPPLPRPLAQRSRPGSRSRSHTLQLDRRHGPLSSESTSIPRTTPRSPGSWST
jgi:hypothetical protein